MRNLYALLVGIDRYAAVPALSGCVRDVTDAREHLEATLAPGTDLVPLTLLNEQATRDAVVGAITSHLGQAGPDDVALFWFAGHGSDWPVPAWAKRIEPTGRLQSLVCADSRSGTVPDLWDKELSLLLDDVSDRAGHVAVVLDSCHSDGATRELLEREPAVRTRSVPPGAAPDLDHLRARLEARLAADRPAEHIVLAACQSTEAAEERTLGPGCHRRGVFTWSLLQAMRRLGPAATYNDLLLAARTEVELNACRQVPQARPRASQLLNQRFLGGAVTPSDREIRMRRSGSAWVIDAGAMHGLEAGDGLRIGVRGDPDRQADVVEVRASDSRVAPIAGWAPDPHRQYPVVVTAMPTPLTTVATGDEELRAALARSLDVRVLDDGIPDLRAHYADGELAVVDQSGEELLRRRYFVDEAAAAVEHIARWLRVWHRRNGVTALGSPVRVEVLDAGKRQILERDSSNEYVVQYDGGDPPEILIRLRNDSDRPLFCALLDLTSRFKVDPVLFPGYFVAARDVGECLDGRRIKAFLPPTVPVEPGASVKDRLKLFVAEAPFGVEPFVMPALAETLGVRGSYRDLGDAALPTGHDWTTDQVVIRIEVPR
ncbi:caspase family protein [Paractinoplanes lichenicola]|uniref:Caspase family protein n=1 Tax=Paractinoplanes lichenicola TaxID=2802976 RepID=A0ABS1W366_9ACTN|nr:caspase family protein [Actinoplanes lichenicola]MBL7261132.1 caspase family protein [Actinoplanes lichenicola]